MTLPKLDFLSSRKFYAICGILILSVLTNYKIVQTEVSMPLIVFLFSFIGINLVGKVTDAIGG